MKNNRLKVLFSTLDPKEIRNFQKFIRSPFFNKEQILIDFFDFLVNYQRRSKAFPSKEKISLHLFPEQVYKDVRIRLLMSSLHKLIEHFLVYNRFFQNPIQFKIQLAKAYRLRNLPKHFEKNYRASQQLQEADSLRGAEYYFDKYQLQLEHYRFISIKKRTEDLYLQELSNTIDLSFIILKLRQSCYILAHQQVYKKHYDFGLLEAVIEYAQQKGQLTVPAVAMYYYCYLMLKNPNNGTHFNDFQQLIFKHGDKFPESEIRDLYLLAINYCIKRINDGNEIFRSKTLELYKNGLSEKFLLEDNILSRFTYNNIVAAGLMNKEFDWVNTFIDQYKNALEKKYRESTFSFNKARLEYDRKNYPEALTLLQKSEYEDLLNNLIAKTLLMKIYYELEEFDLLTSHLDAMNIFIRRKKIIGYHQENYRNIISFTRRLIELNPFDKDAKKQFRTELEASKVLSEKDWILAQL